MHMSRAARLLLMLQMTEAARLLRLRLRTARTAAAPVRRRWTPSRPLASVLAAEVTEEFVHEGVDHSHNNHTCSG